jgi:hypothetical protein
MPALTLDNLFRDIGIPTPTTQNFRFNMPAAPLADGESMRRWVVGSLAESTRSFGAGVLLPYTAPISWEASYVPDELPDRIAQLSPITATVTASNIFDDAGTPRPGTISIASAGVTINTTARTLSFTGTITNSRSVTSQGAVGGGDFFHSCTLTLTFTPGANFNSPVTLVVDNVIVETQVIGSPPPPTPPLISANTFTTGAGLNLQWSAAGGILTANGPWTYEWATDAAITNVVSTSAVHTLLIAPGTVHTIYLRLQNASGYSDVYFGYYDDPGEPS